MNNLFLIITITIKKSAKPMFFNGGFVYKFDNFADIDSVLDVMFRVLHSNAPLDYAICIQINDNYEQLQKLSTLNLFGQIVMAADTAYRYRYNSSHKYKTSHLGLFQNGDNTLEVHEFTEIL